MIQRGGKFQEAAFMALPVTLMIDLIMASHNVKLLWLRYSTSLTTGLLIQPN
jgi:hypothetical protein